MNHKLLLLAPLWLAAASAGAEQVYKWTDASGVVHYTDAPPPKDTQNVQTVRVTGGDRPHPVATDEGTAGGEKAGADANANGSGSGNLTMDDNDQNRRKACEAAKQNLDLLQNAGPVAIAGADGKPKQLDDAGRKAQIAQANAEIMLYCK
ncbi:MAG TPA: DUF4124 domain-containing protein [Rudaea sp.]|nr:DUF4124 domain-containing protein [Rudaea sp.]